MNSTPLFQTTEELTQRIPALRPLEAYWDPLQVQAHNMRAVIQWATRLKHDRLCVMYNQFQKKHLFRVVLSTQSPLEAEDTNGLKDFFEHNTCLLKNANEAFLVSPLVCGVFFVPTRVDFQWAPLTLAQHTEDERDFLQHHLDPNNDAKNSKRRPKRL